MRRLLLPLSALALLCAGCASGEAAPPAKPVAAAASAPVASVRADTLAAVARRLYRQEAVGVTGHVAVRRIARDQRLLAALESGDPAALRAEALRQLFDPGKHVVRLSVVRNGRTLVDVGGAFVVEPARQVLRAPDGAQLGVLQASIQDVIGYVKLVRRFTGVQIVVRGNPGHVESSLAAAKAASLPSSGVATVGGHRYELRSFTEPGFGGERLHVWILSAA